jgi:hypothetical protein
MTWGPRRQHSQLTTEAAQPAGRRSSSPAAETAQHSQPARPARRDPAWRPPAPPRRAPPPLPPPWPRAAAHHVAPRAKRARRRTHFLDLRVSDLYLSLYQRAGGRHDDSTIREAILDPKAPPNRGDGQRLEPGGRRRVRVCKRIGRGCRPAAAGGPRLWQWGRVASGPAWLACRADRELASLQRCRAAHQVQQRGTQEQRDHELRWGSGAFVEGSLRLALLLGSRRRRGGGRHRRRGGVVAVSGSCCAGRRSAASVPTHLCIAQYHQGVIKTRPHRQFASSADLERHDVR